LDYAQAIHSTLPEGGVAPFELGGVAIFAALEELAASLERRQKKRRIHGCDDYWSSANVGRPIRLRSNVSGGRGRG
jgi:hypothetical protein